MSDLGSQAWQMVRQSRFLTHDPEQLWAMVESADGATASELGVLLTQAAKTISEIGDDLRTHSLAVEWEGEGGEAFRTWIHQAALATLGLGEYSEGAGKWLGHAADTLHEVKPQLEILRNQSATARSVLDAHAAKATDIGNHDGGPSDAAVENAKTSYADDSAEAGGLMMKLAQSYTASTEQIDALEAPKFPELPEQFVPERNHGGTHVSVPSSSGAVVPGPTSHAQAPDYQATLGARPSETNSAVSQQHTAGESVLPHSTPGRLADATTTMIDSVGTLPSAPATPSAPLSGSSSPESRTPSPTGLLPPAFGGGTTPPPGARGGGRIPSYGGRTSVPTPSGPSTSGNPRAPIPARGLHGPVGPSTTGSQPTPRSAGAAPVRGVNGITGGRPATPATGRPAGAIPRGNVIGGAPSPQQTPVGRRGITGSTSPGATQARDGGRMANRERGAQAAGLQARSDGIAGGQPRPPQGRGRTPLTRGSVRATRGESADVPQPQRGATARSASASSPSSPNRGERAAHEERSDSRPDQRAETEEECSRPTPPRLPSGPDGHARREG